MTIFSTETPQKCHIFISNSILQLHPCMWHRLLIFSLSFFVNYLAILNGSLVLHKSYFLQLISEENHAHHSAKMSHRISFHRHYRSTSFPLFSLAGFSFDILLWIIVLLLIINLLMTGTCIVHCSFVL